MRIGFPKQKKIDKGKRSTNIRPDDSIFLEVGKRDNSLSAKFDGPYLALDQKGSNVLVELPRGSKWYHVDSCKRFERKDELFIPGQVPTPVEENVDNAQASEFAEAIPDTDVDE